MVRDDAACISVQSGQACECAFADDAYVPNVVRRKAGTRLHMAEEESRRGEGKRRPHTGVDCGARVDYAIIL